MKKIIIISLVLLMISLAFPISIIAIIYNGDIQFIYQWLLGIIAISGTMLLTLITAMSFDKMI